MQGKPGVAPIRRAMPMALSTRISSARAGLPIGDEFFLQAIEPDLRVQPVIIAGHGPCHRGPRASKRAAHGSAGRRHGSATAKGPGPA